MKKVCHCRKSLSGIYNACCHKTGKNTLSNGYVEDPRLQISGMTPYFITTRGFTLIELLVVVLIIGILAAVAVPQYQVAVKKADLSQYMQLVRSLRNAEEIYYLGNGTYTGDLRDLDIQPPAKSDCVLHKGGDYYACSSTGTQIRYGIFNNITSAQAGDSSIRYMQFFADFSSANGIQFPKGTIACFSKGEIARRVCRSLGASTEYESGNTTWDYYYILN